MFLFLLFSQLLFLATSLPTMHVRAFFFFFFLPCVSEHFPWRHHLGVSLGKSLANNAYPSIFFFFFRQCVSEHLHLTSLFGCFTWQIILPTMRIRAFFFKPLPTMRIRAFTWHLFHLAKPFCQQCVSEHFKIKFSGNYNAC